MASYEAPILTRIRKHANDELAKGVIESSPKASTPVVFSYKDILVNVNEIAKVLTRLLAARPEGTPKHVTYAINPSIAYVVVEIAVWAAGACAVPLSVHSPAPELEYFCENSESPLSIADKDMEAKLKPVVEKLKSTFAIIGGELPNLKLVPLAGTPEADGVPEVMELSSALILYTSGTTGKPKGALHTFRSLTAQYDSLSEAWKWSSKEHTLHVLPCHHIHGIQNILNTALYNGACVEFCPFDAAYCLKRIASGDITCFHAVPTVYVKFTQYLDKCTEEQRAELCKGMRNENLRYMVSGSAALPVPTMKSWADISGHVLLERYGMTEIGMALSNNISGLRSPGCVGWPLPSAEVKLDDNGGILVKGPCLFREYYRMEEATKKEFTEDGWFKTGDNAQVGGSAEELQALHDDACAVDDATGRPDSSRPKDPPPNLASIYKILGRSSVDIIKSGGYKISALEIESVLLQHERIKECAVVGKPDETWGEKVTAVCVLDGDLTLEELRKWGKERLATYKVPQELEALTELPRNQMGKLEKKKLLDRYKSG